MLEMREASQKQYTDIWQALKTERGIFLVLLIPKKMTSFSKSPNQTHLVQCGPFLDVMLK